MAKPGNAAAVPLWAKPRRGRAFAPLVPRCTSLIGSSLIFLAPTTLGAPCTRARKDAGAIAAIVQTFLNTMWIPIDRAPFFAGPGAVSAVYLPYMSETATQACGKWGLSLRVGPQIRPCSVAHRLFGITKLRSARLAWPDLRANAGCPYSVNRP